MPTTLHDGRYVLGALIGVGPLGEVHEARDALLQRRVAVKRLHPWVTADPERLRRFERGTRAASRLSHAGIVGVLDRGRDPDGRPFAVMELVDGRDLRAAGPLSGARTAALARALVPALRAAHAAGVVHGDVKASNVLLRRDGRPQLCDFGLTHAGDAFPQDDLDALHRVLWTPAEAADPPTLPMPAARTPAPHAAAAAPRRGGGRIPLALTALALAAGAGATASALLVPGPAGDAEPQADRPLRTFAATTATRTQTAPATTATTAEAVPPVPPAPPAAPAPPVPPVPPPGVQGGP